jgi:hypothetical protein
MSATLATAPKPLIPGLPDWATNLSGWVWLVAGVVTVWIIFRKA